MLDMLPINLENLEFLVYIVDLKFKNKNTF